MPVAVKEMERDWREMFSVQGVDNFEFKTETAGDCNANCLPLDQFNEPEELEVEVNAA